MEAQFHNVNNNPRTASFSCYLSPAEDQNFVHNLAESIENPTVFASSQETPYSISLGRTKSDHQVGEINVFGAEKYFNMKFDDSKPKLMDDMSKKQGFKRGNQVELLHMQPKSRPGTPSAVSDASWNSQTALLPRMLRTPSHNKHKKVNGKSFFATLSCNGSCADKKSVFVDTNVQCGGVVHGKVAMKETIHIDQNSIIFDGRKQSQARSQSKDEFCFPSSENLSVGSNREENFAFPNLKSGLQNSAVKNLVEKEKIKEEIARKSLEVFGSHMVKKGDIAMNLERKLSMLTWDAIPKSQSLSAASSRTGGIYEDNESDASSDLFEIENLSGNGPPLFTRQASDGMSSCMTPRTRYEPSEASIEWSVVTASAADFSANSDYDEKKLAETGTKTVKSNSMIGKEAQRSRASSLLGCKSHKAVRVAETAYIASEKAKSGLPRHRILDAAMPVGKLQAGAMVKDFYFP